MIRGRGCAAASVCVRMAAHDWSIGSGRRCGDGAKADGVLRQWRWTIPGIHDWMADVHGSAETGG